MNTPAARPLPVSIFKDGEPVIQSHSLLGDADSPLFGQVGIWDFNGVVRRNANVPECGWRATFSNGLNDPEWNLTARETFMIMANPRHEALIDAGVHLAPEPFDVQTAIRRVSALRTLAGWAEKQGLPARMGTWRDTDLRRFIKWLRQKGRKPGTLMNYIVVAKFLHEIGPALALGGPAADPWHGMSARKAAKYEVTHDLSTPTIAPEVWFPLVRAAWIYVHTFAPDVLRAMTRYQQLRAIARTSTDRRGEADEVLDAWLADPGNRIPLHDPAHSGSSLGKKHEGVNWNLLALFMGFSSSKGSGLFTAALPSGMRRREKVWAALAAGHPTTSGLIHDLVEVTRADGNVGPWHPGLDPRALTRMLVRLRDAAFCLVAALSMMRDSEIHEIRRGSVIQHYTAPAIKSHLDKGRAGRPGKHWWIIEPAAEAITLAEIVSVHDERVFSPMKRPESTEAVHGDQMIDAFINEVNSGRAWSGLDEIPEGRVRPHMFRHTMAMLTDQFPGSEIALGIQLKHVAARALANRTTQSYAAADTQWAELLETALEATRFRRFKDLYGQYKDGKPIGYGAGAERVKETFDDIISTVKANGGDARVEDDLLRKARITIRFGMLNNCLFDEANPQGAVCRENTVIPKGHTGPLDWRCRPDRCHNSMIGIEHVPIYDSHKRTQLKLLETRRLPAARKAVIHREVERADAVLAQVKEENT
ncbi:integrase [Streptomyces sp. JV180]|uniref:integrase n=1 Tax=Streptomyces sp. JV180 TaxID=858634 RepID=UPI001CC2E1BD|nr:integrase [Streptomyces sp. JV180]